MSVNMSDEVAQQNAGDLLRMWQILTMMIFAASPDPDAMDRWYEGAKRLAEPLAAAAVPGYCAAAVVTGHVTTATFHPDFIERYKVNSAHESGDLPNPWGGPQAEPS